MPPEAIVKITRAPQFNYRLENEYRILSILAKERFVEPTTFLRLCS